MSKKEKKTSTEGIALGASAAATGSGALAYGTGKVRQHYQSKVNPNKIVLRGGSGTKGQNVFDTQRASWGTKFRESGIDVEERTQKNFDTNAAVVNAAKDSKSTPLVTIDVGSGNRPGRFMDVRAKQFLQGQPMYRMFSDIGAGNQVNPPLENSGAVLTPSPMYAPSNKTYTRNIAPGFTEGVTPAKKGTIGVTSIATNPAFSEGVMPQPKNAKKQIFMSAGGGWQYRNVFQGKDGARAQGLETVVRALDKKYKPGNYELTVLEGHNNIGNTRDEFRGVAAKYKDRVKTVEKTDLPGIKKMFGQSDIAIMAPGSISAELASIEGYKPKVIATNIEKYPHFKENIKFLNKQQIPTYDLQSSKSFSEDEWLKALDETEKSPASSTKSTVVNKEDISKIMATAKQDFADEVVKTKKIKNFGKGMGAVGATIGAGYLLKKHLEKKAEDRRKEDLKDAATITTGTTSVALGYRGLAGNEKKNLSKRDIRWVASDSASDKDVKRLSRWSGAPATKVKDLSKDKKVTESLIGILYGGDLNNPKFSNVDLKSYTHGSVLNSYETTQKDIEDHWTFYDKHKDSNMLPETMRADQVKTVEDLDKKWGEGKWLAKKRMAFAGQGVLLDDKKEDQLKNVSRQAGRDIKSYNDILGDKDFVFQKKLNTNIDNEFRVTIANNEVVDVIGKSNKGLEFTKKPLNPFSRKARQMDEVRSAAQNFANHLKIDPKGVHSMDVALDLDTNTYKVIESNAANGANVRHVGVGGSARRIVNAYKKGKSPLTYAAKRKFIGGAALTGATALALNVDSLEKKSELLTKDKAILTGSAATGSLAAAHYSNLRKVRKPFAENAKIYKQLGDQNYLKKSPELVANYIQGANKFMNHTFLGKRVKSQAKNLAEGKPTSRLSKVFMEQTPQTGKHWTFFSKPQEDVFKAWGLETVKFHRENSSKEELNDFVKAYRNTKSKFESLGKGDEFVKNLASVSDPEMKKVLDHMTKTKKDYVVKHWPGATKSAITLPALAGGALSLGGVGYVLHKKYKEGK